MVINRLSSGIELPGFKSFSVTYQLHDFGQNSHFDTISSSIKRANKCTNFQKYKDDEMKLHKVAILQISINTLHFHKYSLWVMQIKYCQSSSVQKLMLSDTEAKYLSVFSYSCYLMEYKSS